MDYIKLDKQEGTKVDMTGVPSTMQLETFPFAIWALSERMYLVIVWRAHWGRLHRAAVTRIVSVRLLHVRVLTQC
jgi:hypothetical protein